VDGDHTQSGSFAEIEHSVYEAAIVPEKWPAALDAIGRAGDGFGAVLFSATEWATQWVASPEMHTLMKEFVESGWAARNTRMAAGLRKGFQHEPRFVTEADCFEPGEVDSDPLHTDFLWPNGLGSSAGTLVKLPHGDMLCFSVEKKLAEGPVGAAALRRLDNLRPHLVRSALLAARLGVERARTAVDTLTQLGFAAAGVAEGGRVLVANAAFEVESAPWTTRGGDRIGLLDQGADRLLSLSLALDTIGGTGGVRSIPLRSEDMAVRHVLHVIPVRGGAHDIFTRSHAILVITTAVDREGSPAVLQALFDLTAAEASLARKIGAGKSLSEIAVESGRSIDTLRNQLKSVLAKTACDRQADLVKLLTRLVPPAL
jgi:DNA-binding CsgD family transcriptional regulator